MADESPASCLLLVPTAMERDRLLREFSSLGERNSLGGMPNWHVELCGFGVVAAAAMTMRWLQIHQPDQVILAGIAGSLDPTIEVGSACWFSSVTCDGIGVERTDSTDFLSASELGWNQIDSDSTGGPIGDRLALVSPHEESADLLTVCAASGSRETARQRHTRLEPKPIAEDMEGFAVALACRIQSVPCSIVRGISNQAGDRDHKQWKIERSLQSVAEQLVRFSVE